MEIILIQNGLQMTTNNLLDKWLNSVPATIQYKLLVPLKSINSDDPSVEIIIYLEKTLIVLQHFIGIVTYRGYIILLEIQINLPEEKERPLQ